MVRLIQKERSAWVLQADGRDLRSMCDLARRPIGGAHPRV